ncbi:MAG: hypothetical protein KA383_04050 [Phycisphaerae bacterium]|nr:hypothetical protein [Phycisphaerae bacterium]
MLIAFAVHYYLGEDGGTFGMAIVIAFWGVILLAAPLIHRFERNSILTYALTTQRAITVTRRLVGTRVRTILLRFPCRVELELHRNGTGSVYFGDRGTRLGTGAELGVPMHFRHVADARVVYELIIRHMPSPLCAGCGYNLTGNVSGRCPECGTAILPPDTKPG